jgi:hypothetical protein
MPETTMDKNDLAQSRKRQIGFSGQIGAMKTESIAKTVSDRPNLHLGFGVGRAHASHDFTPRHGVNCIRH